MASQLNDLLVASGIAQLSNYGFASLQTDVKKAVSEMILDHLPQKVVLELASSICDSLARGKHPHFEYNIDDSTITLTKSEVSPSSGTGSTQEEKDANNFREMLATVTKSHKSIDTSNSNSNSTNQAGNSSPKTEIQSSPKSEIDLLSQLSQKKIEVKSSEILENEGNSNNNNLDTMTDENVVKPEENSQKQQIDQTSLDQIKKIFESTTSSNKTELTTTPKNTSNQLTNPSSSNPTDPFGNLYSLLQNKISSGQKQQQQIQQQQNHSHTQINNSNVPAPAVNNVNNFLAQMQAAQSKKNSAIKFNSSSPIMGSPSGVDSPSSNLQKLLNNLNQSNNNNQQQQQQQQSQSTGNPILDLLNNASNKDQAKNTNLDTDSLVHLGKSLMERMQKKEDSLSLTDSIFGVFYF